MQSFKENDTVALMIDLPKQNLRRGQVGTVVLVYDESDSYEVEFNDREGFTYAVLTLYPEQLMRLYYEPLPNTAS